MTLPPTEPPLVGGSVRPGSLLLVNTGEGKGKTTAALGVVMRSVARGWNVAVIQFLESADWKVGEERIARTLGVDWWALGDGFTWDSTDMNETEALAREAWREATSIIETGDHHLVVLDEVTYPMTWGWIDVTEAASILGSHPGHRQSAAPAPQESHRQGGHDEGQVRRAEAMELTDEADGAASAA